jgi:hypothetical protein
MYRQFVREAEQQTGKSPDAWKTLLMKNGLLRDTDGVRWLQQEHGLALLRGDRISYRIAVSQQSDINGELRQWLERAYNATAAGPA